MQPNCASSPSSTAGLAAPAAMALLLSLKANLDATAELTQHWLQLQPMLLSLGQNSLVAVLAMHHTCSANRRLLSSLRCQSFGLHVDGGRSEEIS